MELLFYVQSFWDVLQAALRLTTWFYGCTALESITVAPGNEVYRSSGDCLIETASGTLIAGCKNSQIPDDGSVRVIGKLAFATHTGLTELEIPEGVEEIGYGAFARCTGL
ncbi:MAG: leucine-rich repeat protein, partial [Treponema sp.]|nr:leucine-rich repeat protein [Treponema sp.]